MMRQFGLIGRDISHSFSANFFNKKFADENLEACYYLFDIPDLNHIEEILSKYPNLCGLNVTSPFKRDILPFLDHLSPEAQELNSVNTIKIIKDGGKRRLVGFNTDSDGFRKTIEGKFSADIKAVILGTGGAASAVAYALKREAVSYEVISRTPDDKQLSYASLERLIPDHKLIINATPVGMGNLKQYAPEIPYELLTPSHIVYDLIYNPAKSLMLQKAEAHGATIINGLQMLINQANLSWQIWNGH